jgi:serine/threonine protein kinase
MNILEELKNRKHPNIIRYLGSTEANNTIYFFMELCATSVEEVIKKEGKISENTVFKWFNQILQGLAFLGSQSIMHRDLKPDNLLLDDFGNIKIADLGLAKHDEVMNTLGAGTPLYKAPEVYDDHTYDSRCDVWSLGLILYEMLTGKIFFEGVESI